MSALVSNERARYPQPLWRREGDGKISLDRKRENALSGAALPKVSRGLGGADGATFAALERVARIQRAGEVGARLAVDLGALLLDDAARVGP